jgi:polar amino acid transport system permease protein
VPTSSTASPGPSAAARGSWRRFWFASYDDGPATPPLALAAHAALALALLAVAFTFVFQQIQYHWNWPVLWKYRTMFWRGWLTTVVLALAALGASTVIGTGVALLGRSRFLPARVFARIYVELIRGTPLLVQILLFFYVVADAFRVTNRYVVGVLTLSLFAGAYIAEIVRAGLESVGRSQWDTARAIGLTRLQTYRWVVLPQTLRQVLPPLAGQFVSLVKDSSLLSVIAIAEFSLNAQQVNALTYSTLESYLPLAFGYLLLTLPISIWSRRLERRVHYHT